MKRHIYFIIILISLVSIIWTVRISTAKYKGKNEINLSIQSAPFYFNHSGSDMKVAYHNNNANIDLTIKNYIDKNYTIENIDYKISITNENYSFSIDGNEAQNNSIPLTIEGNNRKSKSMNILFKRLDTSNVPSYEDIEVVIETNYPYTYKNSFKITIVNGEIEVMGNPTNWTKENVTLEVLPVTEGVELVEYSFDGGSTWSTESTRTYIENTAGIKVCAKDNMGTILGPIEVDITKIDKIPPTFNITKDLEYNQDGTTKEVDTLIAFLGEQTSVLKNIDAYDTQSGLSQNGIKCYVGETEITTTDVATSVGRYKITYKVADAVGNETTIEREALIRWPLAGKYILARQEAIGTGLGTETIGMGLYADNEATGKDSTLPYASKYYYSGKTVDNYLSFPNTSRDATSATTWRIINIAENDSIKMLYLDALEGYYNMNDSITNRSNFYKLSIYEEMLSWVESGYVGNDSNDLYINFSDTGHIDTATFYLGAVDRRGTTASDSSTLLEVTDERTNTVVLSLEEIAWKSKLGLINVTDVTKSSNSTDIFSIRSMQENKSSYENTSWIGSGDYLWSLNYVDSNLQKNQFWRLDGNEFLSKYTGNTFSGAIAPVVYLKNNTILSGIGTSADPFVVQEDWGWFDSYQQVQ